MNKILASVSLQVLVPGDMLAQVSHLQNEDLDNLTRGLSPQQMTVMQLGLRALEEIKTLNLTSTDDPEQQVQELDFTRRLSETETNGKQNANTTAGEGHSADHNTINQDELVFLFLCLAIGQLMKYISHLTGIPYTSLVTIVGLIFGIAVPTETRIGKAINIYSNIDAHFMLMIFLPPLIFESSFNSDWHIFKVELN